MEPQQGGAFTRQIIESKEKVFSVLPRLYAFSDLPMAHDIIIKFYVWLYKAALPKVNVPNHELARELASASKSLRSQPPRLREFYEVIRRYSHRVINENPDLTFSLNYLGQLFFEALYLRRPYLTKEKYLKICKTFGDFLEKIAEAIRKYSRIDLYNNLYDLYIAQQLINFA
ncbi:MAG: hypothetical protein QXG39_09195 [Candidatus Aenigmatarchaeota archaeon]